MRHPLGPLVISLLVGILAGGVACRQSPIKAPRFDPVAAAHQAMAEYDANKDGSLDAEELTRCPGLLAAKGSMDRDGDGKLSESEIVARLRFYQASRAEVVLFPCRVLLDGMPLAGATVTLTPEKFMGPTFQPATGVTMEGGDAIVSAEDVRSKGFSGVYCGLYRVQISCKDAAGKERVPAKYNTETTLGRELTADSERRESPILDLSSSRK
jgi:hypothetical protein